MAIIASEVNALREIATEDWYTLAAVNDEADGFKTVAVIEREDRRWSRTVHVITAAPSGALLRWQYEHGLTECQENEFDAHDPIVEVVAVEKVVTTIEYEPV